MFSIDRWKKHRLSSLAWANTWERLWSGDLSVRRRVDIGATTSAVWRRKRGNIGSKCAYKIVGRTAGAGAAWLSRSHYQKDNPNWPGKELWLQHNQEVGESGGLWAHCWFQGHMTSAVRLGLETTVCTVGSETHHPGQHLGVRRLTPLS